MIPCLFENVHLQGFNAVITGNSVKSKDFPIPQKLHIVQQKLFLS